MAMQFPRDIAVRVLTGVLSDRKTLDEAMSIALKDEAALEPAARAWLQEICSGTLRWKGRIDLILDSIAMKKKPSGWLRKSLSIAAYQLIAQERVHPGAAVSEAVAQIKSREGEAPAKFANATLRKISEHAASWRALPFPENEGPSQQAQWASLPEWLWVKLLHQQGLEWSKAYALASLERPTLWIRSRREEWLPDWATPGPWAGTFRATEGGSVVQKEGFGEGQFLVQDISSQTLVREIAKEVLQSAKSGTALDLCAAPGGKAVGLAWSGLKVVATDKDESRFTLLKQTVDRLSEPGTVQIIERGEVSALSPQDLVWVDAPCTGTGILRRHPEVRWLKQEKDIASLRPLQAELIQQGWSKVRPGGYFAYSVCSVLKEEGPGAIEGAKLGGTEIKRWNLTPHQEPKGDGFWAILIRKPD